MKDTYIFTCYNFSMEHLSEERQKWLHTIETFIIVALFSYSLYGGYIIAQASEGQIENECQTIQVKHKAKAGYGSPFNLFSSEGELLMKVDCGSESSATAHIGNGKSGLYIYKYGHNKVDGKWKKIRFNGNKTAGSWIVGNAAAEIEGVGDGEIGSVLAYMCQKAEGKWRCGCENYSCAKAKWQLQTYGFSEEGDDAEDEVYIKNKVEEDFTDQPYVFDNHPMTYYTSHMFVRPGDKVSVSGFGYGEGTPVNILWDDTVVRENVKFYEGKDLFFTVPKVSPGKYTVTFEQDGVVAFPDSSMWVKPSKETTPPEVTRISKEVVKRGDTITLYGSGFTPEQNDVITGFGDVNDISSEDGKSITFTYNPFSDQDLVAHDEETLEKLELTIPMNLMVVNVNGSSNVFIFELKYD
jgi:hypothetical protein